MKKFLPLLILLASCLEAPRENTHKEPKIFKANYYIICHRGIEYITRTYGESSFTIAVDKNKNPIQCQ